MDEIQQLLNDAYDSSRWYHERSGEQRSFDDAVIAHLGPGKRLEEALKEAVRQMPGMEPFLAGKTVSELADYYERLHRLEQEIAIADTMGEIVARRNRKAQ
ncbi:MAG: hypothetical protein NT154_15470 [Verrucomicrobia bacterium]|nr:hypothetical protein [Verrucomicrobiota bacterium]